MKKLLLVIDYQHDFIDGALGFKKAPTLSTGIKDKIRQYHTSGDDVILTMDTHDVDYLSTQEGQLLPIMHCIEGTKGFKIYSDLSDVIDDQDLVFRKSTFGSLALGEYLKHQSYASIELVGLVTNMCVISNAIIAKSALPEAKIIIDSLLCASFSDELHEKALDVMRALQMEVV
jgi:nicotinamidase-related amidase